MLMEHSSRKWEMKERGVNLPLAGPGFPNRDDGDLAPGTWPG